MRIALGQAAVAKVPFEPVKLAGALLVSPRVDLSLGILQVQADQFSDGLLLKDRASARIARSASSTDIWNFSHSGGGYSLMSPVKGRTPSHGSGFRLFSRYREATGPD